MDYLILKGDCIAIMATMDEASIDSVVCDPPYGIRAMGMAWDGADIEKRASSRREAGKLDPTATHYGAHGSIAAAAGTYNCTLKGNRAFQEWCEEWSTAAFRVLKPGGHMLACGSPRTHHRLIAGIEDAGFEIRDCLMWLYGSGFPKSHNVANSIDKLNGHPNRGRAIPTASLYQASDLHKEHKLTSNPVPPYEARSEQAKEWEGWGTGLKPSFEPIVLARKPLGQSVARSVLEHRTGALNIDATRIGTNGENFDSLKGRPITKLSTRRNGESEDEWRERVQSSPEQQAALAKLKEIGRWPANMVLDEEIAAELGDKARYFYCSKASKAERNAGLDDFAEVKVSDGRTVENDTAYQRGKSLRKNAHPCVKPLALMRWLVRMVTPPGGTVLDPFVGSGTTGVAAIQEGFDFLGIDQEADYVDIAKARMRHASAA